MSKFGERIAYNVKRLREARRLSVKEASEKCGFSVQTIYHFEKNQRFSGDTLDKLAAGFKVDVSEFLKKPRAAASR